jgi:RHS repeat-associated protein
LPEYYPPYYECPPSSLIPTTPIYTTSSSNNQVKKIIAQSGAVVWSATYTSFGKATIDTSSTITNNLRFPGQYYDQETGLHYNDHRYYDSDIGRYLREDPVGCVEREVNLFAYVINNPINSTDPEGLYAIDQSGNPIGSGGPSPCDGYKPFFGANFEDG